MNKIVQIAVYSGVCFTNIEAMNKNFIGNESYMSDVQNINAEIGKTTKKILVVSTSGYGCLDKILNKISDIYKNERLVFYIINEIYQGNKPENVKYENYLFTPDSGNSEECDKVLQSVGKWNRDSGGFDYSIQTDEFAVDLLGFINTKLNLKGLKLDDCYRFRDKVKMKQLLSNDIKKPKLYSLDDIISDKVQYPVILKPRCFAGSRGVKILNSKDELLKEINKNNLCCDYSRVSGFDFGEEDVEVEEYIDAPICHIDGIIFNKEIKFCIASEYINTCLGYTNGKILGSIKGSEQQQIKALELITKVNKCLELPNGVFHMEAFWKENDYIFLEIASRPGGSEIVPSIELSTGLDLSLEHIKCQIGIEPGKGKDIYKHFGWLNFPCKLNSDKELHIKDIKLPDSNLPSLKIKNIPKLDERVDVNFTLYSKNLGSFVFASNDQGQMKNDMEYIKNNYKFTFE